MSNTIFMGLYSTTNFEFIINLFLIRGSHRGSDTLPSLEFCQEGRQGVINLSANSWGEDDTKGPRKGILS